MDVETNESAERCAFVQSTSCRESFYYLCRDLKIHPKYISGMEAVSLKTQCDLGCTHALLDEAKRCCGALHAVAIAVSEKAVSH